MQFKDSRKETIIDWFVGSTVQKWVKKKSEAQAETTNFSYIFFNTGKMTASTYLQVLINS